MLQLEQRVAIVDEVAKFQLFGSIKVMVEGGGPRRERVQWDSASPCVQDGLVFGGDEKAVETWRLAIALEDYHYHKMHLDNKVMKKELDASATARNCSAALERESRERERDDV
jgi:hypothetical protein